MKQFKKGDKVYYYPEEKETLPGGKASAPAVIWENNKNGTYDLHVTINGRNQGRYNIPYGPANKGTGGFGESEAPEAGNAAPKKVAVKKAAKKKPAAPKKAAAKKKVMPKGL